MRSLELKGADDLGLHALEWSQSGRPLWLMHGFGHSARVWDEVVGSLTDSFRVLAVDQRGHGDSDHDPERGYSHPDFGRDLVALTEGVEDPLHVVVGHSMGGYGAMHFAGRHPERLAALVVVDAGADLAQPKAGRFKGLGIQAPPRFETHDEYARTLVRTLPLTSETQRARLARHWLRRAEAGHYELKWDPAYLEPRHGFDPLADRSEWAEQESARLWGFLEGLTCPLLVVRGEHSPILSVETARRMVEVSPPGSRFAEVQGAGHPVMLDNPADLSGVLEGFLSDLA
ncbi:alpha/beta hydrolase [Myxococcota bacterium]|nr:alpha/beta hydrolase [Myxococcota bacterium]